MMAKLHKSKQIQEEKKLTDGVEPDALQSGEELALEALAKSSQADGVEISTSEEEESDKMAETLTSLQNLVERHALQLEEIKDNLRNSRSSLRDIMENDPALSEAKAEMETYSLKVKDRKTQVQANPESMALKAKIGELNEQQKELEETLSNHLVNYHSMTNSNSFDTSDGDQWEFVIKAKIKPRPKSKK
jgi:hypothetical protein